MMGTHSLCGCGVTSLRPSFPVFGVSASKPGSVFAVDNSSWVVTSVRQCGHAKYGSGFSNDRFIAFNGFVNDLQQEGFRHL